MDILMLIIAISCQKIDFFISLKSNTPLPFYLIA
jgi:hypothetical protein